MAPFAAEPSFVILFSTSAMVPLGRSIKVKETKKVKAVVLNHSVYDYKTNVGINSCARKAEESKSVFFLRRPSPFADNL